MNKLSIAALVCVAALVLGSWPAAADTLQVRFYSDQGLVSVLREAPDGADLPIAAAKALVAGPDGEEAAIGFKSALPEGTRLMSADVTGETIKLDLSPEVLEGLAAHKAANPGFGIEQVHFFPLGGIKTNAQWVTENGGASGVPASATA